MSSSADYHAWPPRRRACTQDTLTAIRSVQRGATKPRSLLECATAAPLGYRSHLTDGLPHGLEVTCCRRSRVTGCERCGRAVFPARVPTWVEEKARTQRVAPIRRS